MPEHVEISTDEIHICHNYSYADATAREAASSFVSADIGKIARQEDNNSFWVLTATTPVWVRLSAGSTVNAQTGTTYTVLAKDRGKLVTHANASAIAVTLPQASSTGFGADWFMFVLNTGAGAATYTPTTSTINGAASMVFLTNEGALIVSDGTNYKAIRVQYLTVDSINAPVFAQDAGANDTYTATLSPAPTAYVTGNHYRFKANTANTGACTINFNGLGAKTIKKCAGGITTDLADNDIRAGQWVDLVYDGTNMQMQSQLGNAVTTAAPSGSAGGDLTGTYPNPRVAQVNDANGNELLKFGTTASAINEVTITNKAAGNAPTIEATGGDTDISLNLKSKGAGNVQANGVTVLLEFIQVACSDESTALTTGTAKITFRMPFAMTVTAVRASLSTAQASGSIFTVDINEAGTTILSTKLTIDNTEKTSTTAATPAVISDTSLADDAEITVDIDQIGDGTAKGLKVTLIGIRG